MLLRSLRGKIQTPNAEFGGKSGGMALGLSVVVPNRQDTFALRLQNLDKNGKEDPLVSHHSS